MKEVWKDVVGYEGLYKVSNLGRVKSLSKYDRLGRFHGERILHDCDNGNGYRIVNLKRDGKQDMRTVHRLVMTAFVPNDNECSDINHIDGDKTNNHLDNLEWCTRRENMAHAVKNGLLTDFGQKKVMCVETGKVFKSTIEAEKWVGIKAGNGRIGSVCNNRKGAKTCGGFHWRFV